MKKRIVISAVCVDFHNTLVGTRGNISSATVAKRTAEEVLGCPITEDARLLKRRAREIWIARWSQFANTELSGREQWAIVNEDLYTSLGYACVREQGREISRRMSAGDIKTYGISRERRAFFAWLFERKFRFRNAKSCRTAIASNGDQGILIQSFLWHFQMGKYFNHIFNPQTQNTAKPSRRFFESVSRDLKTPLERILLIGNSPFHDGAAATLGMQVLILQERGEGGSRREVQKLYGNGPGTLLWARTFVEARRQINSTLVSARV